MIRLPYGYGIDADNYGLSVGVIKTQINKETGVEREYLDKPTYPMSIKSCIKDILKREKLKIVRENDCDLITLMNKFETLQNDFLSKLDEKIKQDIS